MGIRVLIADDSALARSMLRSLLEEAPDMEVVGEACNGREAVDKARELRPNVMTMDLEMPVMNGLDAIEEIMHSKAVPILVVSSVADARDAVEAVARGALEVVAKPKFDPAEGEAFVARVRLLAGVSVVTRFRPRKAPGLGAVSATPASPSAPAAPAVSYKHVFAIACSTGGPQALAQILPTLPADFPCPVLIAQHISDGFAGGMVDWLGRLCKLPVRLGREGELVAPGTIYISPSEGNMTVTPSRRLCLLPRTEADLYHPSCDALLQSVAMVFGARAIGIILTGMGHDGALGMAAIRRGGGRTLGQDEASSVIYGMNKIAIDQGTVERVLPVTEIGPVMADLARPDTFGHLDWSWT